MTLYDVAERAGISVPYLSEIERGKLTSKPVAAAIADALMAPNFLDAMRRAVMHRWESQKTYRKPPVRPPRKCSQKVGE